MKAELTSRNLSLILSTTVKRKTKSNTILYEHLVDRVEIDATEFADSFREEKGEYLIDLTK